ncbi:MAG: hypothetical protein CL868_06145 [Cytophagaceae bacterium]|nr:hypothetical protein [Cytophagaceae bacterium]|tara:strand:- start:4458 stop:4868 length:411 start_codon:yes stop_codon:yes gene_type:complete
MQLQVDEQDKKILIKDGAKTQNNLLKFLMFLNLGNALLNLFLGQLDSLGSIQYLWIFVALISVVLLYWFFTKKSSAGVLAFAEIDSLQEKDRMGVKRFSLKLKNGKVRDLTTLKNSDEIANIKKVFSRIQIPITQK